MSELQQLINCTKQTLDQVESAFYARKISLPVYEAYCHLWRTSAIRFTSLCAGYENVESLCPDTQLLIKAYRELR